MKKHIVASVLLGAFFFAPLVSIAEVIDIDPSGSSSSCLSIENNLKYRMRDTMVNGEVSDLQDFLGAYKYLDASPTGFFGIMTLGAVKKFQSANGITPTGYVGTYTRAKIKALSCDGDVVARDIYNPKIVEKPTPIPPVACTAIARLCPDGSMMPRLASCEWIPEKCKVTPSPSTPMPNTAAIPYDTCRLDSLSGMNITQNAYADQAICVATLCDVWGPANLKTTVPTESKCVFKGQEIKRYTNSGTATVTPKTPSESVTLKNVVVGSSNIAVIYDKNFITCVHLVTADFKLLHTSNYFCGQGGSLTTVNSPSDLSAKVQIGQQVKLCHGNNYGICSNLVTVTTTATPNPMPPPMPATPPQVTQAPISLADCDYTLWKSNVQYPLQELDKENAARAYVEGRLGKDYVARCVERAPQYDNYNMRRIGFIDKRLTRLLDYTKQNTQLKVASFYVDLASDNTVDPKWMILTGLLPECVKNTALCTSNVSIDSAFGEAIKSGFPTTTVTVLTQNVGGIWRWAWTFYTTSADHKLQVDMLR